MFCYRLTCNSIGTPSCPFKVILKMNVLQNPYFLGMLEGHGISFFFFFFSMEKLWNLKVQMQKHELCYMHLSIDPPNKCGPLIWGWHSFATGMPQQWSGGISLYQLYNKVSFCINLWMYTVGWVANSGLMKLINLHLKIRTLTKANQNLVQKRDIECVVI